MSAKPHAPRLRVRITGPVTDSQARSDNIGIEKQKNQERKSRECNSDPAKESPECFLRHIVIESQLTSKLTDRRALTCQISKTPRHQSQAQTAVRCSDLVRQSKVHPIPVRSTDLFGNPMFITQKSPIPRSREKLSDDRPVAAPGM